MNPGSLAETEARRMGAKARCPEREQKEAGILEVSWTPPPKRLRVLELLVETASTLSTSGAK